MYLRTIHHSDLSVAPLGSAPIVSIFCTESGAPPHAAKLIKF